MILQAVKPVVVGMVTPVEGVRQEESVSPHDDATWNTIPGKRDPALAMRDSDST